MTARLPGAEEFEKADAYSSSGQRTHYEIADISLAVLQEQCSGYRPVAADGRLWVCRNGRTWTALSRDELEVWVGEHYRKGQAERHCKKAGDYRAIADLMMKIAHEPHFFPGAPKGIAAGELFFRVTADSVSSEALVGEHRARFVLPFAPNFDAPAPWLTGFLERAFACKEADESTAQIARFGEIVGASLLGLTARLQKMVVFYGPAQTGKSCAGQIITALVPDEYVTATSPHRWDNEYYIAALQGKLLNLVGELSQTKPLPAADVKRVRGGDRLQGRHPNHRPSEFYNQATHIFITNFFPPTEDRSEGFFRSWCLLHFSNPIEPDAVEPEFHRNIVEREMPQLLAFALQGAQRLMRHDRFTPTAAHDRLLQKWRLSSSSVLEFMHDESACLLDAKSSCIQGDLFKAYRAWCDTSGRKPIGRNSFFEELDQNGHVARVRRQRSNGYDRVMGVDVVYQGMGL